MNILLFSECLILFLGTKTVEKNFPLVRICTDIWIIHKMLELLWEQHGSGDERHLTVRALYNPQINAFIRLLQGC